MNMVNRIGHTDHICNIAVNTNSSGVVWHEHLPEFGLINMNGRLYDPVVGRFLSPDPYVATPDFSQGFNRYSYVLNNPLMFTDPSGYMPKWLKWALGDMLSGGAVSATALMNGTGITLGSSITIDPSDGGIDFDNMTLLHEYGHYRQIRSWGGVPMLSLSLASFVSTKKFGLRSTGSHKNTWTEMDANARSLSYFHDRMEETQRLNFSEAYSAKYYDFRFYRHLFFPGLPGAPSLLGNLLIDITWSN
jgi:RHS repeat-associated protein